MRVCLSLRMSSVEGRDGVFDDAAATVSSDQPQRLGGHLTLLHVEQLQLGAVGGQDPQASACHALARPQAQPP